MSTVQIRTLLKSLKAIVKNVIVQLLSKPSENDRIKSFEKTSSENQYKISIDALNFGLASNSNKTVDLYFNQNIIEQQESIRNLEDK